MVPAAGEERHAHRVAVHSVLAVALGHKDGFAAIFRLEGVLAICFAVERAGHHLRRHVQRVVSARLLLDEVIHEKPVEHIDEKHLGTARAQMKLFADTLQRERHGRILLKKINHHAFQIDFSQTYAARFLLSHSSNVFAKLRKKK